MKQNKKNISSKVDEWSKQGNFDDASLALLTQARRFTESLASQKETSLHESLIEQGLAIASELQQLKCDSETLSAALIYPSFLQ
ncbi:MAG TPA: hypothetical protein VJL60_04430 [Gammaproteobacteria bacterium]|nr:hypothetical protein [Gammaproteobacteria bacterium]